MKEYKLTKEFFGGILHNYKNKNNFYLDCYIIDFIELIHGKQNIEKFEKKHGFIEMKELLGTMQELFEQKVILDNYDEFEKNDGLEHLSAPFRIFYDISYGCNLRCKHCFTKSGSVHKNELSFLEKKDLIQQCVELGVGRISIAGGEPFFCDHFFSFLDVCKENGLQVSVTTNGTLFTVDNIKKLNTFSIKTLTVSLDGAYKETVDVIRGSGCFDKVMKGLEILNKFYSYDYSIKTTLMKQNINDIEAIIQIAIKTGCKSVKFNCVREDGRAKDNKESTILTNVEYIDTVKRIESLRNKYKREIEIKAPLNIFCSEEYEFIKELGFGCFAGKESICIDPCGNVKPCSHFPDSYICGNIKKEKLNKIWDNSKILYEFRNFAGNEKCNKCEAYEKCRGGCRYRAFMSGNINSVDPYCYIDY